MNANATVPAFAALLAPWVVRYMKALQSNPDQKAVFTDFRDQFIANGMEPVQAANMVRVLGHFVCKTLKVPSPYSDADMDEIAARASGVKVGA